MKHVLITGGSEGLGKVTAKSLLTAGFKVTILSRDKTKTEATAKELGCAYAVADVSKYDQVEKAIKQCGEVDILINNAGVWAQGPLESNDPDEIRQVIEVNVVGTINCTRALIADFKKRGNGRIINIGSQAGLYAKAERSVYNASKWGVTGFTKALQAELRPSNVAVTGIYPGAVKNTSLFAHHKEHRNMDNAVAPEQVADTIVYICKLPDGLNVPELGIDSLAY